MKISENKHIKKIHHVSKKTHDLLKKSKICNYANALLLILILSVAILAAQMFLNKQNTNVPEAEIRFSELSKDNKIAGTIMPASCESSPIIHNGDANYTGCTYQVNGSCSTVRYACTAGNSASNADNATTYTWTCAGSAGFDGPGTSASCSETKPPVVNIYFSDPNWVDGSDTSINSM